MANVMQADTAGIVYDPRKTVLPKVDASSATGNGVTKTATQTPEQNLATAMNAGNFLYNYAANNADVGMGDVIAAGSGDDGKPGSGDDGLPGSGDEGEYRPKYRGGYSAPVQAKPTYTAAQLPTATSQAEYINAMYDANEQRRRAALEAEYAANVGALDRQAANIPAQYQNAANAAGAQAAINQAAFNERAAAAGLNTGAAGQAALAQNNALLAQMSTIRQNQAQALNDVESQRVSLSTQYQKAIADAIAANEADRAAALYNEAKRVDESLVNTAVNQAAENYRAWQAMYK